ncbi:MAG: metal ABC transporter ATP-binding protein [bacterium]|nr:metal ABC transporter ATP-binding protein [bacterium]
MSTFLQKLSRTVGHHFSPHVHGAPILRLRDVRVEYEQTVALDNVSFEIQRGDRVAVVGPNGAGKSTLFKVIAGVERASAGTVEIFGNEPEGHICIGYVPQRSQIDWNFPVNVADMVMMGRVSKIGLFRQPRREDREHVRRALEQVGLTDLAKRRINRLSGGQQQRIFIARALAQEAELLLLDEPFMGLDAAAQQSIFEILERLGTRGVTILVSLHDLNMASKHFGKVMLLRSRLLGYGAAAGVITAEHLVAAYGAHLHMVKTADGALMVSDTHCEGCE